MKIRESNINDINQIASLMLQVAEIHFDARKDIFKEKNIEQIKSELKERFENNESILVVEENKKIIGVLIYKIKEIKKQTKISYNNTGLLKGKTYYYKVMAYRNMSGIYVYGKYSTVKQIRK